MRKPEFVLENETRKILWEFEIQMNFQISFKRSDLVLINKNKRIHHLIDFAIPVNYRSKIKESW